MDRRDHSRAPGPRFHRCEACALNYACPHWKAGRCCYSMGWPHYKPFPTDARQLAAFVAEKQAEALEEAAVMLGLAANPGFWTAGDELRERAAAIRAGIKEA